MISINDFFAAVLDEDVCPVMISLGAERKAEDSNLKFSKTYEIAFSLDIPIVTFKVYNK